MDEINELAYFYLFYVHVLVYTIVIKNVIYLEIAPYLALFEIYLISLTHYLI